jgi:hypothetical protein
VSRHLTQPLPPFPGVPLTDPVNSSLPMRERRKRVKNIPQGRWRCHLSAGPSLNM